MLKKLKLLSITTSIISIICFNINAEINPGKVSIIIPVYNTGPYIEQCLKSVINQTYKNLEIICIDDCGCDDSIKIVEKYKKKYRKIRILYNEKNKGLAITRNVGVKNSTGEYIFFLDSDDYLNLDTIEKLVKKQKVGNYDLVVSHTNVFLSNNKDPNLVKVFHNKQKYFNTRDKATRFTVSENNFQDILASLSVISCGKLYKKSFLSSNNIWYINQNIWHEDDGFNLKVLSSFPKIIVVNDVGVNYRIRESSIVTASNSHTKLYKKFMTTSLNDAFSYIKNHMDKISADKLIKFTKTSPTYIRLYLKELSLIDKTIFVVKEFFNLNK